MGRKAPALLVLFLVKATSGAGSGTFPARPSPYDPGGQACCLIPPAWPRAQPPEHPEPGDPPQDPGKKLFPAHPQE